MPDGARAPALDDPPLRSSSELTTTDDDEDEEEEDGSPVRHHYRHYHAVSDPGNEDGPGPSNALSIPPTATSSTAANSPDKPWAERFSVKRNAALDDLFTALDTLVVLELFAIYYTDTSTFLLLLRLSTHLTQLPFTLSILPPTLRKHPTHNSIPILLFINTLSILLHVCLPLPQAGEATRYDLQGHIFVDFVGQRAPVGWSGRGRLVGMDLLVLGLQILGAGVMRERERRGAGVVGGAGVKIGASAGGSAGAGTGTGAASGARDDAMNRASREPGILQRAANGDGNDIEMRPLMHHPPPPARPLANYAYAGRPTESDFQEEEEEEAAPPDNLSPAEAASRSALEELYSGQSVVLDMSPWHVLREQYYERRNRALVGRV